MYNHDILAKKRSQANKLSSQTDECKIQINCENERNQKCEIEENKNGCGNGDGKIIVYAKISSGKDFDEESLELFSERDDDDDKDDDINKTLQNVPTCQSIEDNYSEVCDSDELFANLSTQKIPSMNLIDNKCPQDVTPANSSINPLKKEQLSSNKCEIVDKPGEQSSTQPSTSIKQSDIGAYFGIKPLKKAIPSEQKPVKVKEMEGDMDSLNGDYVNGRNGGRKCPFYKRIPGNYLI